MHLLIKRKIKIKWHSRGANLEINIESRARNAGNASVDATAESENFLGDSFRCFGTVPELAQIPILGHEGNFGASSGVGVMLLLLGKEFFEGGESVGAESRFVVIGGRRGLSESGNRVRVQLELVRHCSNL